MHLAQLFQEKPSTTLLWVYRNWPVTNLNGTFYDYYKYPVLVGYNPYKQQFAEYETSMYSEEHSIASFIPPIFLEDKAWKLCKDSQSYKVTDWTKKVDLDKARRIFGLCHYSLRVENGLLKLNTSKSITFLRV